MTKRGAESSGYVRVLIDRPRNKPIVTVDIPIGSDSHIHGPLKSSLQSLRTSLGSKAPSYCHQNVYWLCTDSRQPAPMTEAVSELLPLASDEEINPLFDLLIPQLTLSWHHPHTSRALQLVLKRGSPEQRSALIAGLKGHVIRFTCSIISSFSLHVAYAYATPKELYDIAWELERGLSLGRLDEKDSLSQVLASAMEYLPTSAIPSAFRKTLDHLEDFCFQPLTRGTVIAFLDSADDPFIVEACHILSPLIPDLLTQRLEGKERRSIVKHLFAAVGRLMGRGRAESVEKCLVSLIQMQEEGLLHEHFNNHDLISGLKELNDSCSSKQRSRLLDTLSVVLKEMKRIQDVSGSNYHRGLSSFEELIESCASVVAAAADKTRNDPEPSVAEKKAIEAAILMSLRPMVNEKEVRARSDFGHAKGTGRLESLFEGLNSDGCEQGAKAGQGQVQERQMPIPTPTYTEDQSQDQPQNTLATRQDSNQLSYHEANQLTHHSNDQPFSFNNQIPVPTPLPIPVPAPSLPPSPPPPQFVDNDDASNDPFDVSNDLFTYLIGKNPQPDEPTRQTSYNYSQNLTSSQPQLSFQTSTLLGPSSSAPIGLSPYAPAHTSVPPHAPALSSFTSTLNPHVTQINQATSQHLSLAAYPQASSHPLQPLHHPPSYDLTTLDDAMKIQQPTMMQKLQLQQSQALQIQQSGAIAHQLNPHGPPPPVLLLYPVPVPVVVVQVQPQLMTHASSLPSIVYNAQQQKNSLAFAHPSTLMMQSSSSIPQSIMQSMSNAQANTLTQPYNPFQR